MKDKDKELRRMSRAELIEIIYQYRMKTDELTSENEKLKAQLEERIIKLDKSGSIAEAALSLNSVFEAAQNAANQYLESVKASLGESVKPEKEAAAPEKADDTNADKPAEPKPDADKPADLQPKIVEQRAKTRRKNRSRRKA